MLSRANVSFARVVASKYCMKRAVAVRGFSELGPSTTAEEAAAMSGYADIDFAISENAPVLDAVQKFAAYNIGCLVTTDDKGEFFPCWAIGVCGGEPWQFLDPLTDTFHSLTF